MKLFKKKEGYVTKGNRQIQVEGNTPAAMQTIVEGLNDYQNRVINALTGYQTSDTALLVVVLRALADSLEKSNPDSKQLIDELKDKVKPPEFQNNARFEETKRRK